MPPLLADAAPRPLAVEEPLLRFWPELLRVEESLFEPELSAVLVLVDELLPWFELSRDELSLPWFELSALLFVVWVFDAVELSLPWFERSVVVEVLVVWVFDAVELSLPWFELSAVLVEVFVEVLVDELLPWFELSEVLVDVLVVVFVAVLVDEFELSEVLVEVLVDEFELSAVLVTVELSVQVEVPPSLAFSPLPSCATLVDELVDGSVVWAWAFRPKASDRAVTSKVLFMLKFP